VVKLTYSVKLLDEVQVVGASQVHHPRSISKSFQVSGQTTAGTGYAIVIVQVTNVATPILTTDVDWVTLGTFYLPLSTTKFSDIFSDEGTWRSVRGKVVDISGTGAAVTLLLAA